MATFAARVERAGPEQPGLDDHAEHCSADPEALAGIGRRRGEQIRVGLAGTPGVSAVFTIVETRDEADPGVVRLGPGGRARLGGGGFPADAAVDSVVARRAISDDQAARLGEFVERLVDDGRQRDLIVLAPHGGQIEPHTDEQAERVAARLSEHNVTLWCCKGFGRGPGEARRRFHITTTDLHVASFPALRVVIGRGFHHAVAFHGQQADDVLIGGRAQFRLKAELANAIEEVVSGSGIRVRITTPADVFGGDSPHNLVNRITIGGRGGIHVEQSLLARRRHGVEIADVVARVFVSRSTMSQEGSSVELLRRPSWWRWRGVQRYQGR